MGGHSKGHIVRSHRSFRNNVPVVRRLDLGRKDVVQKSNQGFMAKILPFRSDSRKKKEISYNEFGSYVDEVSGEESKFNVSELYNNFSRDKNLNVCLASQMNFSNYHFLLKDVLSSADLLNSGFEKYFKDLGYVEIGQSDEKGWRIFYNPKMDVNTYLHYRCRSVSSYDKNVSRVEIDGLHAKHRRELGLEERIEGTRRQGELETGRIGHSHS